MNTTKSIPVGRFIPACAGNADPCQDFYDERAVHPRMRGERSAGGRTAWACLGSSPHARGTPGELVQDLVTARFIPAYAGNASGPHDASGSCAVHPRIRGERKSSLLSEPSLLGSSPHARGTHALQHVDDVPARFIPACAGNAVNYGGGAVVWSVHPRMRGERSRMFGVTASLSGSSPHARGTLLFVDSTGPAVRFIPACAGNARITPVLLSLTTVHPRMRGERILRGKKDATFIGSSPHARGTLCTLRVPGLGQTVHPRMRGERPSSRQSITPPAGSSPHARGTQVRILLKPFQYRFIPACAGNAMILIDSIGNLAVHPRMRGERQHVRLIYGGRRGSSPHARGTLRRT